LIPSRVIAWLLAACAALPSAAPVTARKPAAHPPSVITDEQLYKSAMECKVRVEALVAVAGNARERKCIDQALAFWSAQEKAVGAKLGKSEGDMMKDEIFFGLEEGSRPGGLQRATLCVQHAAVATRLR
jgi:hypothetical protein